MPVPLRLWVPRDALRLERDDVPVARDPLLERVALDRRRAGVDPDFEALLFERAPLLRCAPAEVDLLVAISAIPSSRFPRLAYPPRRTFSRRAD
jgi:plasmid maintenance system killer protein